MGLPQRFQVTPQALKEHQRKIDLCRGSACLFELGRAFGTSESNQLERIIDGKKARRNALGEAQWSRKYARYQRGSVPDNETINNAGDAAVRLGKTLHLSRWRDHVLWTLVREPAPDLDVVRKVMADLPRMVRKHLHHVQLPDRVGRMMRRDFSREDVLMLRDAGSLDAFCALLALAREGEILEDDPRQALPARCAFEMFPLVVMDQPHLHVRWQELFAVLELAIWSREYHGGFYYADFTLANALEGLARKAQDRKAVLPWTAGVVGTPVGE